MDRRYATLSSEFRSAIDLKVANERVLLRLAVVVVVTSRRRIGLTLSRANFRFTTALRLIIVMETRVKARRAFR